MKLEIIISKTLIPRHRTGYVGLVAGPIAGPGEGRSVVVRPLLVLDLVCGGGADDHAVGELDAP